MNAPDVHWLVVLLSLGGIAGCGAISLPKSYPELLEMAQSEREAAAPDSDEAIILERALADARDVQQEDGTRILTEGLVQARNAKEFKIANEAPLPENWPRPSLPGLVRIKTYPAVRAAWVRSTDRKNGQFMTLFRHIQKRKIAMTAPVVMEYAPEASADAGKMNATEAMAFLYRRVDQDEAGSYGQVSVKNEGTVHVVSMGVKGAYTTGKFRKALKALHAWLEAQDRWRVDGPPRVLGYNSPFMPFWSKYSEVQIPVRDQKPPETGSDATGGVTTPLKQI